MVSVKIGLEVHIQLTNLRTKLFCGCSSDYRGKEPNTNICPVCMGEPGTLPVLNAGAVEDAVMVAFALGTEVSRRTVFSRKNYFYPDMPKNFQISQYDGAGGVPFAVGGVVTVDGGKRVRIRRIQLEEDPGKLVYEGTIDSSPTVLVDYNRAGIALAEVVTEPDIESPREARLFLQKIRSILEHLGVSDGSLEGAMRCDANISMAGGKRVEVKNISSFKDVERALNFEVARQRSLIGKGLSVGMETRHWDATRRITVSLRVKEEEQDYRYFPEPDLVPIVLSDEDLDRVKQRMPMLPDTRKIMFSEKYGVPAQNADVLTGSKTLADFFEECLSQYPSPEKLSNWLVGDLLAQLHESGLEITESKVTPSHIVQMLMLIDDGTISGKIAKKVLQEMVATGKMPHTIVEELGLKRIASREEVKEVVAKVFTENPGAVEDALKDGKAAHFLIGQLMKATRGRVDPILANEVVREKLAEISASRRSKR